MEMQNRRWTLFARAVDPDQDSSTSRTLGFDDRLGEQERRRKRLNRTRFGRAGTHRRQSFVLPRVGGGTDLGILTHPRRGRSYLCGEPCEQGHKGKEYPVHLPRI